MLIKICRETDNCNMLVSLGPKRMNESGPHDGKVVGEGRKFLGVFQCSGPPAKLYVVLTEVCIQRNDNG